ncbi:hypothetical protein V495_00969 [Pseudogymnoascus sp. VKM F-4514 (FW-929)]|nr:hypothetical protein V495_00969 [Pseudogymnoascus sp. VKM F-4514 (FW-929)]KFY51154.1 hypothetical protein V497_09344 [Pseudogymnoascus sp. VKM F-4516 (FW-969)]
MAPITRTVLGQLRREALVTTKPMQCLSRQYMSTAAHAGVREPSEKIHEDAVTQALRILQTAPIAWNNSGSAAFDFRSDVVTKPTLSTLAAIIRCSLDDDVYREDAATLSLESHMAYLTGFPDAIFVNSGTMANQLALRTHLTQPPHAILADSRSHILHWEAGGIASLTGAMVQPARPSNGEFLTLDDVKAKAVLSDDVHKCPTRVISLENTIGGIVQPLEETRKISVWAREKGVKLHLDGARLWEAVAAGKGNLREYGSCFDSVGLDFSKGLGAPMGAVIVGGTDFVARARRIRKGMGGGMRQLGVLSSAARESIDSIFGPGPSGYTDGGLLRQSHRLAARVAGMWTQNGGKLSRRTETNIVWIDLKAAEVEEQMFNEMGAEYGLRLDGSRVVLHYQISEDAIAKLEKLFIRVLQRRG